VGAGLLLLLLSVLNRPDARPPVATDSPAIAAGDAEPGLTPLPAVDTATSTPLATPTAFALAITPAPLAFPTVIAPTATLLPPLPTIAGAATTAPATAATILPSYQGWDRSGVSAGQEHAVAAYQAGLRFGNYFDWMLDAAPLQPEGVRYWQMIRVSEAGVSTPWEEIETTLAAQPGAVWVIGNEPDVIWQDNVTPARYAELYHQAYTFIKDRDPTALIAIAGVAQPTPLRLAYLDIVLDSYQDMYGAPLPVDIWNVHNFILREEAGSWGVDIPPGMGDELAIRHEISEHDDIAIFQQRLVDFRAWMDARGYGDHPLAVTEFGVIMPEDFGFPPESVAAFMTAALGFLQTAANDSGYPPDDGRLVQWWFWFILFAEEEGLRTGNLFDVWSGQITPLGQRLLEFSQPYLTGEQ